MRRIRLAEAEHPGVDALGERRGERPPPLAEEPVAERAAAVLAFREDDLLLPFARRLDADGAEVVGERGNLRGMRRAPVLAEEGLRGDGGEPLGRPLRRRAEEVRLGVAEVAAGRGEQGAGEVVPGLVAEDERADAAVVDVDRVRPEVDRELALHAEDVAEAHAPVVGEGVGLEQPVDELRLLVRIRGTDVALRLLGGRQAPRELEGDPAHHHRVGRPPVRRLIGGARVPLARAEQGRRRQGRCAAEEHSACHVHAIPPSFECIIANAA